MSLWQRIKNALNRQKREKEWANNVYNQPPAKPKNPLPLDPGNDPWRT